MRLHIFTLRMLGLMSILLAVIGCSKQESPSEDEASKVSVVSAGELIVKKNCRVCHAQGINGAPIIGNKKMWSDRVSKGKAILTQHAISGFGLMPAKGGNTQLTDDEIKLAVSYMLDQVK